MQCLNDGTPEVRDAAFSVLAAVAKVFLPTVLSIPENGFTNLSIDAIFLTSVSFLLQLVGMRPLEKSLEKLDDVRRKKLSEMIGGSGGGPPGGAGSG